MLLKLFITFFKIGLFTIGGGYAMLPVIQKEVVDNKGWLSNEEFLDAIAITNSLPGPLATNCATFVGYKLSRFMGAAAAVLGAICPSFIIIIAIASVFRFIAESKYMQYIFAGIRPAVVALILFALVRLTKSVGIKALNLAISFVSIALILLLDIHPAIIIVLSGLFGFFFFGREAESK